MEFVQIFVIGVLLTIAFMFLLQMFVKWKTSKIVGKEFTAFGKDIVLYFYSPSCGVCVKMMPVIESLSKKCRVRKVDVSDDVGMKIAKELGILATPTTIVIKDGKIKKVFLGYQTEDRILKEVKK